MPSLQLDESTISYEQFGQGPDIVWIPGGDQRGVHFSEQYEAFPDFRNTAYDPRGVGETISHKPPPWTTVVATPPWPQCAPGARASEGPPRVGAHGACGSACRLADSSWLLRGSQYLRDNCTPSPPSDVGG